MFKPQKLKMLLCTQGMRWKCAQGTGGKGLYCSVNKGAKGKNEQPASHEKEGKPLAEGSIFQSLLLRQSPWGGSVPGEGGKGHLRRPRNELWELNTLLSLGNNGNAPSLRFHVTVRKEPVSLNQWPKWITQFMNPLSMRHPIFRLSHCAQIYSECPYTMDAKLKQNV